jgi:NmrA-like family
MASTKPLMVVFGATGIQGGSVISHFLSLSPQPYNLRGITRNTESSASKALVEKGVEMVAANLDDTASLVKAFQGATAIFTVTDFWHPFYDPSNQEKAKQAGKDITVWTYEYELQQGKNIFDAASQTSTLERLIFSALADATKWSGGKYSHVFHFISKAHAVEYGKETYPQLWKKMSVLQVGFYFSNFLPGMQPLFSPKKVCSFLLLMRFVAG